MLISTIANMYYSVCSMSKKPKWTHPNCSEETMRWIAEHRIINTAWDWEMTGADTSRHWITLTAEANEGEDSLSLIREFSKLPDGTRFWDLDGLVEIDSCWRNQLWDIDHWNRQNEEDIEEFNRLKEKLYG